MARERLNESRSCRTGVQDWPWDFIGPVPDVGAEMDTCVGSFVVVPYKVALAMGTCWSLSDVPAEEWEWSI